MILPRDTIMSWNGFRITEHNRQALSVTEQKIKKSARMVDGTLRQNVVAVKTSYSVSWEMVPSLTTKTVDGYWGGKDILEFARTNDVFTLVLRYDDADGSSITKTVAFTSDPDYEIVGRSPSGFDLVNVSVQFEEV